jgi:hypothetical protein
MNTVASLPRAVARARQRCRDALVALSLSVAFAGCTTVVAPDCSPSFSAIWGTVPRDDISIVDLVFVLDRTASVAEHLPRLFAQLSQLVDPPCLSRSTPGGGPTHVCDPSNPDDVQRYPPVRSLRVGVVSSDLGARGSGFAACETARGDDGRLDAAAARPAPDAACAALAAPPAFLSFCSYEPWCSELDPSAYVLDPARFTTQLECRARALGVGCPIGQPLEALWRALVQHGAGEPAGSAAPNAGFLREHALLAMVVVSDREDHSVRACENDLGFSRARGASPCVDGTSAFSPAARGWASDDVDGRFYRAQPESAQDPTWPIDRYVGERPWSNGDWRTLDSLKPGHPERLLFVAVTGAPVTIPTSGRDVQWDQLLGPSSDGSSTFRTRNIASAIAGTQDNGAPFSMRNEPSARCPHVVAACARESAPPRAEPSCVGVDSVALPARRIIEVARRFDESGRCNGQPCRSGQVRSICADRLDWAQPIVEKIAVRLVGRCLWLHGVQQQPRADGSLTVDCVVHEVQSPGVDACDATRGRIELEDPAARSIEGLPGERRHVCEVRQLPALPLDRGGGPAVSGPGWFADFRVDPAHPTCATRVSFSRGATPRLDQFARIECTVRTNTCR